jgi:hypothetical protein
VESRSSPASVFLHTSPVYQGLTQPLSPLAHIILLQGWVQSYGSRYVRPPIITGDVAFLQPMTVREFVVAQQLTAKPVKGMLTGPVTILNWSFPRKDISRAAQAAQLGLALRREVDALQIAGCKIIQVCYVMHLCQHSCWKCRELSGHCMVALVQHCVSCRSISCSAGALAVQLQSLFLLCSRCCVHVSCAHSLVCRQRSSGSECQWRAATPMSASIQAHHQMPFAARRTSHCNSCTAHWHHMILRIRLDHVEMACMQACTSPQWI